jgi:hypothetical protein
MVHDAAPYRQLARLARAAGSREPVWLMPLKRALLHYNHLRLYSAPKGLPMELLAVSKDTIRAHVIRYFHDVFHTPISAFKPGTNVRNAYSYSDRAGAQLANVFNSGRICG